MGLKAALNAFLDKDRSPGKKKVPMEPAKPPTNPLPAPYASDFHPQVSQVPQVPQASQVSASPVTAPAAAPTVPLYTDTPDAIHTAELDGKWWIPAAASAQADVDQAQRAKQEVLAHEAVAKALEAAPTPLVAHEPVPEPAAAPATPQPPAITVSVPTFEAGTHLQPPATATPIPVPRSVLTSQAPQEKTVTTAPATGFKHVFEEIGAGLKKALGIADVVAEAAEPIVDLGFPAVAPLYNSAVAAFTLAVAVQPTGATVEQQTASLLTQLVPIAESWAAQNKIVWNTAEINAWAAAVAKTLTLIPPSTASSAPTPTA